MSGYKDINASQLVTFPTRIRGTQISLLDLLLTNDKKLITEIHAELPFGLSDHSTIVFHIQLRIAKRPTRSIKKHSFQSANYDEINGFIRQQCDREIGGGVDDCVIYNHLRLVINNAIDKFIPLKTVRHNPRKPWIISEFLSR